MGQNEENTPFYEIKQRYCSKYDTNVILKRDIDSGGEFVCMSAHMCKEDCKNGGKKQNDKGLS